MSRNDQERETVAGQGRRLGLDDLPPVGAGQIDPQDRAMPWSGSGHARSGGRSEGGLAGGERETRVHQNGAEAVAGVAWIYGRKGPHQGQLLQLQKLRSELGRAVDCDLVLEDEYVSAHHSAILVEGESWKVCDFLSSNGTFVNGQRLGTDLPNPAPVNDGDRITIGESEFIFKRI